MSAIHAESASDTVLDTVHGDHESAPHAPTIEPTEPETEVTPCEEVEAILVHSEPEPATEIEEVIEAVTEPKEAVGEACTESEQESEHEPEAVLVVVEETLHGEKTSPKPEFQPEPCAEPAVVVVVESAAEPDSTLPEKVTESIVQAVEEVVEDEPSSCGNEPTPEVIIVAKSRTSSVASPLKRASTIGSALTASRKSSLASQLADADTVLTTPSTRKPSRVSISNTPAIFRTSPTNSSTSSSSASSASAAPIEAPAEPAVEAIEVAPAIDVPTPKRFAPAAAEIIQTAMAIPLEPRKRDKLRYIFCRPFLLPLVGRDLSGVVEAALRIAAGKSTS